MKHLKYILFFVLFISISNTSCVKESDFPVTPVIEFMSFEVFQNDSAICFISFTDGDGDVGFAENDTNAFRDLTMKYLYQKADGEFYPYDKLPGTSEFDTLFYDYKVPFLTPDGQFKALDGEIEIKLTAAPLFAPTHDVVKFDIQLRDRAGNKSNIVSTNEVTVVH